MGTLRSVRFMWEMSRITTPEVQGRERNVGEEQAGTRLQFDSWL
jgi:hypothetical protein